MSVATTNQTGPYERSLVEARRSRLVRLGFGGGSIRPAPIPPTPPQTVPPPPSPAVAVSPAEPENRVFVRPPSPRRPTLRTRVNLMMTAVAWQYGLEQHQMLSRSRKRSVVKARQMAMLLCHRDIDVSMPVIGRVFGGFDHTTVLHACRSAEKALANDADLRDKVDRIYATVDLLKEEGTHGCDDGEWGVSDCRAAEVEGSSAARSGIPSLSLAVGGTR